jgi:hypothetical protein
MKSSGERAAGVSAQPIVTHEDALAALTILESDIDDADLRERLVERLRLYSSLTFVRMEAGMDVAEELKQLVESFREMGRLEAERAYEQDRDIDPTRLDSRPLRALVHDATEPMLGDAHGSTLLILLAQERLFNEVLRGFGDRILQLRKNLMGLNGPARKRLLPRPRGGQLAAEVAEAVEPVTSGDEFRKSPSLVLEAPLPPSSHQ